MFTEVLWTFLKLTVPFCFFLFVLAQATFILYYKVAFQLAIEQIWNAHPEVFENCNKQQVEDTSNHALDQNFPANWESIYFAKVGCLVRLVSF